MRCDGARIMRHIHEEPLPDPSPSCRSASDSGRGRGTVFDDRAQTAATGTHLSKARLQPGNFGGKVFASEEAPYREGPGKGMGKSSSRKQKEPSLMRFVWEPPPIQARERVPSPGGVRARTEVRTAAAFVSAKRTDP